MSAPCPTCGHTLEDELVHSTPISTEAHTTPRGATDDQWHTDLAELVALVRRTVNQHHGVLMTPSHIRKRERSRAAARLRRVA